MATAESRMLSFWASADSKTISRRLVTLLAHGRGIMPVSQLREVVRDYTCVSEFADCSSPGCGLPPPPAADEPVPPAPAPNVPVTVTTCEDVVGEGELITRSTPRLVFAAAYAQLINDGVTPDDSWAPAMWGADHGETSDRFWAHVPIEAQQAFSPLVGPANIVGCSLLRPVVGGEKPDLISAAVNAAPDVLRRVEALVRGGHNKAWDLAGRKFHVAPNGMVVGDPTNSLIFEALLYGAEDDGLTHTSSNYHGWSLGIRQLYIDRAGPSAAFASRNSIINIWEACMMGEKEQLHALFFPDGFPLGVAPGLSTAQMGQWMADHETGHDPKAAAALGDKTSRAVNEASALKAEIASELAALRHRV